MVSCPEREHFGNKSWRNGQAGHRINKRLAFEKQELGAMFSAELTSVLGRRFSRWSEG
jgi:hypothetical protein